jgi:hypothetical protein
VQAIYTGNYDAGFNGVLFREIKMCLRLNFDSIRFSFLPQACDKVADVHAHIMVLAKHRRIPMREFLI